MQKKKWMSLGIVLLVLILLFVLYGVSISPKNKINDWRVLNYLRLKYVKDFEIVELLDWEQAKIPGIHCDGTEFVPDVKKFGQYYYMYKVYSPSDDITFLVLFFNDKGKGTYKDTYDLCRCFAETVEEINKYAQNTVGEENVEVTWMNYVVEQRGLRHDCAVVITFADGVDALPSDQQQLCIEDIETFAVETLKEFDETYNNDDSGFIKITIALNR